MLRLNWQVFLTLCTELLTAKVLLAGAIGGTMTIAELIKAARTRKKWSQRRLANELGISRNAVSWWEAGKSAPSRARQLEVARLLDIPESEVNPLSVSGITVLDVTEQKVVYLPVHNLRAIIMRSGGELKKGISDGVIAVEHNLGASCFAARVDDEALTPLYQMGDEIIVDRSVKPADKDVVVAGTPNNVLMLRCYKTLGRNSRGVDTFELRSSNADFPTIPMDSVKGLRIVGVVIEHRRKRQV